MNKPKEKTNQTYKEAYKTSCSSFPGNGKKGAIEYLLHIFNCAKVSLIKVNPSTGKMTEASMLVNVPGLVTASGQEKI